MTARMGAAPADHPSVAGLKSALYMLERHADRLTPALIRSVTENVQSALEILRRGDPLTERMAFIGLALRQSTEIRITKHGRGREVEHVAVTDPEMFTAAMKMLHKLP